MQTIRNTYAESSRTSDKKIGPITTSARSNKKPHIDYKKSTLKR